MSKNYMAEVAKLLGVELGESFKITSDTQGDYQNYYRFTENNCFETSYDGVEWKMTTAAVLLKHILMGDIRIVKLPWKPQRGKRYYIPFISTQHERMYVSYYWANDDINIEHYRMGIVFKTWREARDMCVKMTEYARRERRK